MGHKKVIKSGSVVEVYQYEKDVNYDAIAKAQRTRFFKEQERKRHGIKRTRGSGVVRPDNARKRKKSFIRLVWANLVGETKPALLTLTMYEVGSVRDAWLAFREFGQRLRRNEGKNLRYIAVPELQKRGAIHYHVLIWGLNEEQVKKESELRYYQGLWQRGFVDCVPTNGSPNLARYLAKHMSKTLLDSRLCGQRAYMASVSVLRPVSLSLKTAVSYSKEAFGLDFKRDIPSFSCKFKNKWLGECDYRMFHDWDQ